MLSTLPVQHVAIMEKRQQYIPTFTVSAEENELRLSSVLQEYLSFFVMGQEEAGQPRRK